MAITKIWALHASLKAAVQYIKNTEKTTEVDIKSRIASEEDFIAPSFSDHTDIQIANLKQALGYVAQDNKTEEKRLVSGVLCTAENALDEMNKEKEVYGKNGGVVGYHCVQSFAPGEIDPDHAHLIGLELAQRVWGDNNYQVVVATHIDRDHIHNHFIINSVSLDGEKNPCCYHRKISAISDDIIRQHGLSVITERGISPAELPHFSRRQLAAKIDIDQAVAICSNLDEFRRYMAKRGYILDLSDEHRFWTIQHKDWKRPMRMVRLGEEYSNEKIMFRLENETMLLPPTELSMTMTPKQIYMYENRYARIQKNWKDTYQYKFFMFMLRNFDINLNDYQVHPERYSRQQKKEYDAVWKSLESVTVLNELNVRTEKDIEPALKNLEEKIATCESKQRSIRNKLRSAERNVIDSAVVSELRSELELVNLELKDIRKNKKILMAAVSEPIYTADIQVEKRIEPEV